MNSTIQKGVLKGKRIYVEWEDTKKTVAYTKSSMKYTTNMKRKDTGYE